MFDCDSYPSGKEGCVKRTESCYDRQIAQLKAELAQCVRRDDPRLENILQVLDDGSYGHSSWQKSAAAKATLQSIIEGK